jgi:hypothetical protein
MKFAQLPQDALGNSEIAKRRKRVVPAIAANFF